MANFHWYLLLLLLIIPILISSFIYQLDTFDAAPLPNDHDYFSETISVPKRHNHVLSVSERVGEGLLFGPEDLAYDADRGLLFTGCDDGWIKTVNLRDDDDDYLKVENWTFVGGRPLGLALAKDGSLVVAEPYQGLLLIRERGKVELLTESAEGLRFGLTDGVDVTLDGKIYFTDASYKYPLKDYMLDVMEARPHGRLLSYDPKTNQTLVLALDLYFANGLALSPDEHAIVFCETLLRQCKKYHIKDEKKGTIELFIQNLPGFPDNIRYDREGHYWIGLTAGKTRLWDLIFKYPFIRKLLVALEKYNVKIPNGMVNGGVLSVDLDGRPVSLYSDKGLYHVTGGLKVGKYLYQGSLTKPYLNRIDLNKHAAQAKYE
ncbi:protein STRICTOSIDINE SYNTHASE-LIKE 5-like [Dioscorea cayenensis subsp. rotundata]|uniref:Protein STRICTOSIDINE SYNTHASE-LIKE 5-like n=1 Tax=Dioscorea cayennensis subsp. rotundata TaxID=55577 RepID=A0AB40C411_DIOCR|nr:protein STRICTOSIDINE SYNTHASE-LIKE 5-like [Dioscorea cayenensis subsp. rotundata]